MFITIENLVEILLGRSFVADDCVNRGTHFDLFLGFWHFLIICKQIHFRTIQSVKINVLIAGFLWTLFNFKYFQLGLWKIKYDPRCWPFYAFDCVVEMIKNQSLEVTGFLLLLLIYVSNTHAAFRSHGYVVLFTVRRMTSDWLEDETKRAIQFASHSHVRVAFCQVAES